MELPTAADLQAMKLPHNLYSFVATLGMERPSFIDLQEWRQLCVLYKSMKELKHSEGFEALADRLLSYLKFYQKLQATDPKHSLPSKLAKKLQRKDRNRSRRTGTASLQKAYKQSAVALAKKRLAEPKIGLGLDSTLPPTQKLRRDQVVLDAHTQPVEFSEQYHALYVAGWSLSPEDK